MPLIAVDLAGKTYLKIGAVHAGAHGAVEALSANGAILTAGDAPLDLLLACFALAPDESAPEPGALMREIEAIGEQMHAARRGRIVVLMSALGAVPMRRFPRFSQHMASVAFGLRALAMRLGPYVQVNGVGAGALVAEGEALAGDKAMLSHVSLGRAGGLADLTNAVLFLADPMNSYTTGQLLLVDGGWGAGYGRNF